MCYPHDYSLIEDSHYYKFKDLNLTIQLCPAHYTFPDIDKNLCIYFIDIIRTDKKTGRINFGETASKLLIDFLHQNKKRAIGYYPLNNEISDLARIKLFSYWEKHTDTSNIVKIENTIKLMGEELYFVIYTHEEYDKQDDLIIQLNTISKSISSK